MNFKTEGERIFAELLTERNLSFEYEKPYNEKKKVPDFSLTFLQPNIIAEVRDVDLNPEDKNILSNLKEVGTAAWSQERPYYRLRRLIHEKADQLKEYYEYPNVIVFYKNLQNITIDLSTENIFESMYADREIVFEVDNTSGEVKGRAGFNAKNAALGIKRNTHISAIAVIDKHRPYQQLANKIVKEFKDKGGNAFTEKGQTEITKLFDAQCVNFDLEVLRLRIIHNHFANIKLNCGIFSSEYDVEVFSDKNEQKVKKYQKGLITDYP